MTDLREVAPPGARRGRHTVDLQWYRSELEQLRRFRLDQLTDLAYDAMATSADAPSEVTSKLMTAARTALADIDAALFRLAIGRFGVCQRCGRAIPADRLQAVPMARLCLQCQSAEEAEGSGLEPATVEPLPAATTRPTQHPYLATRDIVEVWGEDSFPASDPPANW